jgi:hypothetical protein
MDIARLQDQVWSTEARIKAMPKADKEALVKGGSE